MESLRQHIVRLEESLRELVRQRDERHRANGTGPYATSALQRAMYRLGLRVGLRLRRSAEVRHESAIALARARVAELEGKLRTAGGPESLRR